MYFPLVLLHEGNIRAGGTGFGDRQLPAPQAGLMALLAQGIVGGNMPWALVLVGILMGIALIMMQVKSPMLVAVGMYLPFETTFAIFVGGVIRWLGDRFAERLGYNEAQKARVENCLFYISDAADDLPCLDLGRRPLIYTRTLRLSGRMCCSLCVY